MLLKTNCFYDFGNFRLDLTEKVLLREGKAVPLTPKVFRTLQIFVERAGCLIEKDEMMREIWEDRFVDESNLTYNVKMLRKALGDDAARPSFIETVPRRGYRFIAAITEVSAVKTLSPEDLKIYAPPRHSYLPTAAVGILLLCTIAFGSWLARDTIFAENSSAAILKTLFRAEKFSSSGKVQFAAISPDGKLAAYTDETGGKYSLWLKHLETSDSSQIVAAADEQFAGLAFAHDGESIFFVRRLVNEGERAAIYRITVFGGIPEKILENVEGWISVSPDDNQISFVRCARREDDYCALFVADADGEHERRLLTRPRPIRISDNQFSPDGKRLAFAAGESWNGASDFQLWQVDLTSGAEIPLSPKTFFSVENIEWLPDSDGLLIAALEKLDGQAKIWHITADGAALPLTRDAANYRTISLNRDASRMIATRLDNDFRLYLSTDGAAKVLTAAREAVFTFDGKIVYATNDGDIWTIRRDGGEQ